MKPAQAPKTKTHEALMNNQTVYTIIPGAALQFIDYEVDLGKPLGKHTIAAAKKPFHVKMPDVQGRRTVLAPLEAMPDATGDFRERTNPANILPLHYTCEYQTAFKVFAGQWIPFPIFAHQSVNLDQTPLFSFGPTDWCRAWVTAPAEEGGLLWKLTLVFDPQVEQPKGDRDGTGGLSAAYHALSPKDVEGASSFSLAWHEKDNAWFVDGLEWVKKGIREIWDARRKKGTANLKRMSQMTEYFPEYALDDDGRAPRTEYLALYETLLEGIHLSGAMGPPVRVINPGSEKPTDTTLVIDVGNSRITGVIVETAPMGQTRLTDCYPLQIRDLTEPSRTYSEPLDTSVEFMEPWFGPQDWSFAKDSRGHKLSFRWPSTVRVGAEAARLSAAAKEELGPTGMSSPKRYLWDTRKRLLQWYFNNSCDYHNRGQEHPAVNYGAFVLNINSAGIPLTVFKDPAREDRPDLRKIMLPQAIQQYLERGDTIGAFRGLYSRSSLMMFLIAELVSQALSCINAPGVRDTRENPNRARRLKQIILTVPTAMPLAEQNIFKTWARLAVEAVWVSMGWWKDCYSRPGTDDFRASPTVRCEWYEATCTQMVWLYNEINKKFHNNASELFRLLGQKRKGLPGRPPDEEGDSLRVASIDMGGGTTDLSIITYTIQNPGVATPHLLPFQDFRDGFNVAGDDIMREIIVCEFMRALVSACEANRVRDAKDLINNLFADSVTMGVQESGRQQKQLRSQFVAHVAVPIALRILKLYEDCGQSGEMGPREISVRECLGLPPEGRAPERLANILKYVETAVAEGGWFGFSLLDFTFKIDLRQVDRNVGFVVEQILVDMGEIIRYYDCDALILTGRPSRWPAVMRAPYERNFLPVDRIVHMHKYRVDSEYPFVTHGRIEDPKTSVVVGAIICSLAERALNGITIDTDNFLPQPINRYMGMLDAKGKLDRGDQNVWFTNLDVHTGKEISKERTVQFTANTAVGFRQLSCDRWTTTRLYSMEFRDSDAQEASVGRLPYNVTLQFDMAEAEDPEDRPRNQAARTLIRTEGTLRVVQVTDKLNNDLPPGTVVVRLQTLRNDSGYWLDTGDLTRI
ncbi:MAG: virulence factor SrfB [Deltaproteobacteria bacterium]|jgi:hypothetical protein|nr:virulence factor SrfB [Deltaproteobacteria bacterium]